MKTAPIIQPETSLRAWLEKHNTLTSDYTEIISTLIFLDNPVNYETISHNSMLYPVAVSRRLSELERLGLIEKTGTKSLTTSGRWANNYQIKKSNP